MGGLRPDGKRAQHGQQQQHVADNNTSAEPEEVAKYHAQKHEDHKTSHICDGKFKFNVRAWIKILEIIGPANECVPRQEDAAAHYAKQKQKHAGRLHFMTLHFNEIGNNAQKADDFRIEIVAAAF